MTTNLRLDFDNLPLIEAAVRASFNSPKALSYALVYCIHEELKPSFPALTEPAQFEIAPGTGMQAEFGPGYLPGAIYTGHSDGLSVSMQPQVVVARWLKQPALQHTEYPRYPALRDALWTAVEAFRKAGGDEFPEIAVVNMSYVNFVASSDPAGFLRTYFAEHSQLTAMAEAQQVRKLEAAWSEADDVDVRFAIEHVTAKLPEGMTPGYRLTTAAGLRLGEAPDAKAGLEKVHDALQEFFLKLISEKAKEEWKLRPESSDG